jgi:hypothetical protein
VRHIVRPFIKEFKSRLIKGSTGRANSAGNNTAVRARPPSFDKNMFVDGQGNYDARSDALKAADALFGKSISQDVVLEAQPSSSGRVGRILPSLIGAGDAPNSPAGGADERVRRRGRPKAERPTSTRREEKAREKTCDVEQVLETEAAANPSPERMAVIASRPSRRLAQKRWVLKTKPIAGQKWKRRLRIG